MSIISLEITSSGYKACTLSCKSLTAQRWSNRGVSPQPPFFAIQSIPRTTPIRSDAAPKMRRSHPVLTNRAIAAGHDINPAMRALSMPMHPDKLFRLATCGTAGHGAHAPCALMRPSWVRSSWLYSFWLWSCSGSELTVNLLAIPYSPIRLACSSTRALTRVRSCLRAASLPS